MSALLITDHDALILTVYGISLFVFLVIALTLEWLFERNMPQIPTRPACPGEHCEHLGRCKGGEDS